MTVEQFLIFAVTGKVIIYTAQKFPLLQKMKIEFWSSLFNCGFCFGVWIFTFMSAVTRWYLFPPYVPGFSELATGCVTSLVVHLVSIGWKEQFGVIKVE